MATNNRNDNNNSNQGRQASGQGEGSMSVREAGHKGGQRVSELVEEGKQAEGGSSRGSSASGRDQDR